VKISITYRPDDADEERQFGIIRAFLNSFLPDAKVRYSDRYAPFLHVYWATKMAEKPCDSEENA